MKKMLITIAVVFLLFSCKNGEDKKTETVTETKPVSGVQFSETFNQNIANTLQAYYQLKDAFVASDTVKINTAGTALKNMLDSLKLDELKTKDSLGYASTYGRPGDVAAEISGMLGEKGIEKKRESFEMISNAFYDMVRTIRPNGQTVYYQYCPMAFDDKGAYWLSNTDSIRNPYFGKKMLTCGEVKETMKY